MSGCEFTENGLRQKEGNPKKHPKINGRQIIKELWNYKMHT